MAAEVHQRQMRSELHPDDVTSSGMRAGDDGQLGEAAKHEPVTVAPVEFVDGDGEAELGKRRSSDPIASWPSMRASGAPRQ